MSFEAQVREQIRLIQAHLTELNALIPERKNLFPKPLAVFGDGKRVCISFDQIVFYAWHQTICKLLREQIDLVRVTAEIIGPKQRWKAQESFLLELLGMFGSGEQK